MKELVNRPMLLAALLVVPLWIIFGNFLVAAMVALLASFFASMVHALRVLKRKGRSPESAQGTNGKKAYDR
ncbi:MAG TPA: hypothetical protein VL003_12620 [Pusillimonas sp.]|uniref:hypothetical protein n=1 Tax=Pusillimonas sp. TaxID=3040095 RepID=UPI002C4BF43F|nr:hypothetical protein [Pusillimonas sp.]HUH88874.1 hypothetical protein [Pusillimonas sp.]